ncbi:hypothetical protein GmRootV59_13210 [Variovorax sp. V59]|uniref:hypothetical protein n=1 Tax=unclassified Variovorax TaxID=663243 RepID=UPI0034E84528
MTNTLIRTGITYTVPAVAFQPARPAYTSYETRTVTSTVLGSGPTGAGQWVTYWDGYASQVVWVPAGGSGPSPSTSTTTTSTIVVATFHPAQPEVPGSPAMRVGVPPLGWTASAHSIAAVRGAGTASFKISTRASGVAIGLSAVVQPSPGYSHIPQGLLFSSGGVRNLRTGAALGSYAASDLFKMLVRPDGVRFTKNDVEIASEANTYAAAEMLYLAAVLYAPGDAVDTPALQQYQGGDSLATFPLPTTFSVEDAGATLSLATLPALTASSGMQSRSLAVLPAVRALSSDHSGGTSLAALPALDADSYGGTLVVVPATTSYAQFGGLAAASLLLVGETGEGTAQFPAMRGLSADHPSGSSLAPFPAMTGLSYTEDPNQAFLLAIIRFDIAIEAIKVDVVELADVFIFDAAMDAELVDDVQITDTIIFGVAVSTTEIDVVSMRDAIRFAIPITLPGAQLEVHAVNLDGYGSTAYAGYAFNSFARIGDRYYGAKLDGLFLLGGPDDDGQPIDANFCPGKLDFGTSLEKTVSEVYVGVASGAPLLMRVNTPTGQFDYLALSHSDELRQHRFKLGKGVKANYLTPVFYNQDGADFEVDSLEFMVADLSRKTQS